MSQWDRVIEARAERKRSLVARILQALFGVWRGFDAWDDEALVKARVAASVPVLESGFRAVQADALQFQLWAARELGVDVPVLPVGEFFYPRSGVGLFEAYQRPVREAAFAASRGGDPWEVLVERFEGMVDADVQAVDRDETERVQSELIERGFADEPAEDEPLFDDEHPMVFEDLDELREQLESESEDDVEDDDVPMALEGFEAEKPKKPEKPKKERIIGWRRVIRPELSMSGSCGLCVVAATRFYSRKNLKAIHGRCKCIVLPVTASSDPGLQLNQEDLERIYAQAGGSTYGSALKKLRVSVREHGELGSVLSYSPKRGWEDKPYKKAYVAKTKKMKVAELEDRIADAQDVIRVLSSDKKANADAIRDLQELIRETRAQLRAA